MARDQRRLAAIVSADVAGYSRLMGQDDSGTLAALKAHRRELIDPKIAEYGGRTVKTTGDGLLLEFPSVVEAVRCAVDVQRGMAERNAGIAPERRIEFRVGINVGDIILDDEDIYGDGVNVAARLQALAEPGEICVSKVVRDQVLDKLSFTFEDLGAQKVKNIARPVEAYRVDLGHEALPTVGSGRRRWQRLTRSRGWRWAAVGVVAIGLAGVAFWSFSPFRKASPAPTPPALSVAVMALDAPRDDADASRFGETLTRNLVTRLGQIGGNYGRLRVVPAITAATRGASTTDIREMRRSLDVRYALRGDVLHGGDDYTVNLGLIDTATGGQVWSERATLKDSDVAIDSSANLHNLTARIRSGLVSAEKRRVLEQPVSALSARDLATRALATLFRDPTLAGVRQARKLVDEALRLEPELEPALSVGALLLDFENDVDPKPDHDRIVREMDEFTARAISLDPIDPEAWSKRGIALIYLGRWNAALKASAKRISLDPYDPNSYVAHAWTLNMTGQPDEALKFIDRARAMNPFDMAYALRIACHVYLVSGQAERAIATCEKAAGTSTYWFTYVLLAAAYGNNGDMEKARAAKAEILRIVPDYTIAQLRAKRYSNHPEYQRRAEKYWYEGLRKAGIPEQ